MSDRTGSSRIATDEASSAPHPGLDALKRGLTALTSLLPGEDPSELARLRLEFEAYYPDASPMQRMLLEQAIAIHWRSRRLARAEEALAFGDYDRRFKQWCIRRGQNASLSPEFAAFLADQDPTPLPHTGAEQVAEMLRVNPEPGPLERLSDWASKLTQHATALSQQLLQWEKLQAKSKPARTDDDEVFVTTRTSAVAKGRPKAASEPWSTADDGRSATETAGPISEGGATETPGLATDGTTRESVDVSAGAAAMPPPADDAPPVRGSRRGRRHTATPADTRSRRQDAPSPRDPSRRWRTAHPDPILRDLADHPLPVLPGMFTATEVQLTLAFGAKLESRMRAHLEERRARAAGRKPEPTEQKPDPAE